MRVGRDVRFSTVPEWLIYADVSAYAVRVWAVIDRKADTDTGYAEVPLATIARLARCSVNTVKKAIAELEDIEALEVERGRLTTEGDPDSNAYMLLSSDPSRRDGGGSRGDLPGPSRDDLREGHDVTDGVGHEVATKTKASIESPERKLSVRDRFDEFWTVYPRKVGKGAARAKWCQRVKNGADPEVLIVAGRRFAEWCVLALECGELEAMKFIPHAATWLHQERETDVLTRPGKAPAAASRVDRARAEHKRRYGDRHAS